MIYVPKYNYVAIGANAEAAMIRAITGEDVLRIGQPALIANVQLCTQTINEVPSEPLAPDMPSVKDTLTLGWGKYIDMKKFVTPVLRKVERERGIASLGTPIALSPKGLDFMWNWELVEQGWTTPTQVEVAVGPDGSMPLWAALIGTDQPVARNLDGRNHREPYLMDKDITLKVAENARLAAEKALKS
jgi:hypothetical protein